MPPEQTKSNILVANTFNLLIANWLHPEQILTNTAHLHLITQNEIGCAQLSTNLLADYNIPLRWNQQSEDL